MHFPLARFGPGWVTPDMTPNPPPPARARVLVVEDSSVFREMQALLLRQAGYGVWSYESPAAALAEAAHQGFELAVVDYELPGMNGAEFMLALRQLKPGIPVIFVSGSLSVGLVSELTRQGASGIFRKPVNPRVLLEKIHETLNRTARTVEPRASTNLETGASSNPFAGIEPAADRLAYAPHYIYGGSAPFRAFTHQLWRVRDFRSVLLLLGRPGSPFELFARELTDISAFRTGPTMICEAGEFEAGKLCEILAPSLLARSAGTLIVHDVDNFNPAQQELLNELILMRGLFQPFARCFRIVLAATTQLAAYVEAGSFDETLYYKISALSVAIPPLTDLLGDIGVNSLRLLQHYQSTVDANAPVALTGDALAWLESQPWPGDYTQLAHTLYFALRHASGSELSRAALEAGALDLVTDEISRANRSGSETPRPAAAIEFCTEVVPTAPGVRVHPAHSPAQAPA